MGRHRRGPRHARARDARPLAAAAPPRYPPLGLIVVSFAVYRVSAVADALVAAAERGVEVALVLEGDRARRLGRRVAEHASVYEWPMDRRPNLADGTPAALHAKCAVADGQVLLVSSANLTESAMTLNMELGLMVRGGSVPAQVAAHFDALIREGELRHPG